MNSADARNEIGAFFGQVRIHPIDPKVDRLLTRDLSGVNACNPHVPSHIQDTTCTPIAPLLYFISYSALTMESTTGQTSYFKPPQHST